MKKALAIYLTLILTIVIGMAIVANAADKLIDTTVDSVTIATDKNGNEYVRMIVTEDRSLNGVAYKRSLPVMAFGDTVSEAKSLKAGDQLKAVVSVREFQGRESYTILGLTDLPKLGLTTILKPFCVVPGLDNLMEAARAPLQAKKLKGKIMSKYDKITIAICIMANVLVILSMILLHWH